MYVQMKNIITLYKIHKLFTKFGFEVAQYSMMA